MWWSSVGGKEVSHTSIIIISLLVSMWPLAVTFTIVSHFFPISWLELSILEYLSTPVCKARKAGFVGFFPPHGRIELAGVEYFPFSRSARLL